jgi:hypothetical protein
LTVSRGKQIGGCSISSFPSTSTGLKQWPYLEDQISLDESIAQLLPEPTVGLSER